MSSALSTPAASVAGTGAMPSGAPSPSAELETTTGIAPGGEPGAVETAEPGAGASEGAPESGSEVDASGAPSDGADTDGRAIPAKWREAFKALLADAKLRDFVPEAKALLFERMAFHKEFPGGIQEVRGLKSTLDSVGGEAGLQQMQADFADFRGLSNQFLDGDPGFVADLFETDAVAAAGMVPVALDKMAEVDTPAYNRLVAQRIHAEHMAEPVQLRARLKQIYDLVKADNPQSEALGVLNGIAAWHDRIQKIAEQEDDPRLKKLQQQIREGRKSEEQKTQQQQNTEYKNKAMASVNTIATGLLDSYLKGKKLDNGDRESLMEYTVGLANRNILADAAFVSERDRIAKTGNAAALLKFVTARWQKELGIVIPKRVARLFGLSPAAATAATPANGKPAVTATAVPGFAKIAAPPEPKQVDWSRTTNDMISKQHRCFVKGKKEGVYWELAG